MKAQSAPWPSNSRSVNSYDLGLPQFEEPANTAAPGTSTEHPGEVVRRSHPHCQFLDEASPSHRSEKKRKKTKTVAFAPEDDNEVHLVENWLGELNFHSRSEGHVRFYRYHAYYTFDRWIEPHDHTQLHFQRTKWIRDIPDSGLEDLDGDIEMLDAVQEGVPATVESLAEALSRVRLG